MIIISEQKKKYGMPKRKVAVRYPLKSGEINAIDIEHLHHTLFPVTALTVFLDL